MDEKEFRRQLKAIEADAAARLGSPLPDELKNIVASHIEEDGSITYIDGSPDDNEATLNMYREYMDKYVTAVLAFPAITRRKPEPKEPKAPKKIYPKAFERRLYLLGFVLKRRGFGSEPGKYRYLRANWKQITADWNREHPHDLDSAANLKLKYYQAIKDKALLHTYLAREVAKTREYQEAWRRHPEAKSVDELIRIEEARHGGQV